jgi:hypothetical protein
MDISNLEQVSQVNLRNAVSVKVAKEAIDTAKAQGEAVVELIKSAGGIGDDGRLDVTA